MGRRGRTGAGGAVVSSLSQNSGGTVAPRRGQNSQQTNRKPGKRNDEDQELNALAQLPNKKSSSSNSASSSGQSSSSSSNWLGKSPQQMLREWCTKNNRKRPTFYPVEGSEGVLKCVIHPGRKDGKKGKGLAFELVVGVGEKPGEDFAALAALHRIEHGKPIERLLAPVYRDTWLELDTQFEEREQRQAQRAVKRERNETFAKRRETLEKSKGTATVHISPASRQMIEDALLQQKGNPRTTVRSSENSEDTGINDQAKRAVYKHLVKAGFSEFDAMDACQMFSDSTAAIDYLCLTLDESELPESFAPSSEIEVVQFHPNSAEKGPLLDGQAAKELAQLSCLSKITVERALKNCRGDVAKAYSNLNSTLTHGLSPATSKLTLDNSAKATAIEERNIEAESIQAIYGDDVAISIGVLPLFNTKWGAVITLSDGCPGIQYDDPISIAFIDMDGNYPLSSPVVIIASSFNSSKAGKGNMKAAERRLLMRAAAGEIFSLRSTTQSDDDSPPEPLPVIHAVLSFLADATKDQLFNSASKKLPVSDSSNLQTPLQTKTTFESENNAGKRSLLTSVPRRNFEKARPVAKLEATAELAEMSKRRSILPAYSTKKEILSKVRGNQVVVISGATGSGKTTQVPQFLLEEAAEKRDPISIVCTQPRRIAAISVAERVAAERCQKVGESVGYQVKLNSKRSNNTRLMFCTTGILLRRLQGDPTLQGLTHVLVDEVHERSVETDFLLLLLRELLPKNPYMKVVLMSATLDAEKFANYFVSSTSTSGDVPIISIPGRTFPVQHLYLAEAVQLSGYQLRAGDKYAKKPKGNVKHVGKYGSEPPKDMQFQPSKISASALAAADDPLEEDLDYEEDKTSSSSSAPTTFRPSLRGMSVPNKSVFGISKETTSLIDEEQVNVDLIDLLVKRIDTDGRQSNDFGAILIFLPGAAEISSVTRRLSSGPGSNQLWILPLHSLLSPQDQKKVFMKAPPQMRKVICSTNIAETSITVEDVTVVIDTLRVKQMGYDALNGCSVLDEQFISRAAAKQRAGRAGRVSAGKCYRLIREHTFENRLASQTKPEIQRVSLEHLILNVMTILPENEVAGNPSVFLSKAVDPPANTSIETAIQNLVDIGALERQAVEEPSAPTNSSGVNLTGLGKHLSRLPIDAKIGKLLIYGAMFECLDATLTIAATMSERSPFVAPFDRRDEAREAKKSFAWGKSDLLIFLKAFNEWREIRESGANFSNENSFCSRNFLSRKTLVAILDGRKQLADSLLDIGMCKQFADASTGKGQRNWERHEDLNKHSSNERVIKAIICAGLYPNIVRVDMQQKYKKVHGGAVAINGDSKDVKLRDKSFQRMFLHPESVNFFEGGYETRWLAYFSKVLTSKLFLRDSTMVSPYSILLFGGNVQVLHDKGQISVDKWIVFKAPARVGVLARELRKELDSLLLRKFEDVRMDLAASGRAVTDAIVSLLTTETYQL